MIQQVFGGMITLMLAKLMINDLPHATGLLTNPNMASQKQPQGIREEETIVLYHATCERNLPLILEHGITPRPPTACGILVDGVLSEYGLTRSDVLVEIWSPPLERCESTAGRVYLSIDEDYARDNCLAGYEAEYELRSGLAVHKYGGPKPSFEEVFGQLNCVVVEVAVPMETIDVYRGRSLKELKAREQSMTVFLFDLHPEWGREQAKKDAHRQMFGEIELEVVPPVWIRHYSQPFPGKYLFEGKNDSTSTP